MVRVTLEKDFGRRIRLVCGHEIVVPMQFGAADPDVMVEFRGPREALPAKPNEYFLDWANEDERSTLMPDEYAVLYFGNPRAGISEELVRARVVPSLQDERERVGNVWGGYLYSDRHGPYTTIKIAIPDIPHVAITGVDHNGMTKTNARVYRPHEFFSFADFLDPNSDAELAEYHRVRQRPFATAPPPLTLDIANLDESQLDVLAALLAKRGKVKAS